MFLLFKKYWRRFRQLIHPPDLVNIGDFWCDRHFKIILDSQKTSDPIDYYIATMGVGRFITLTTDHEPEGPLKHACDRIPQEVMEGIFERSRGWI